MGLVGNGAAQCIKIQISEPGHSLRRVTKPLSEKKLTMPVQQPASPGGDITHCRMGVFE